VNADLPSTKAGQGSWEHFRNVYIGVGRWGRGIWEKLTTPREVDTKPEF
jgi:hypothetical protein